MARLLPATLILMLALAGGVVMAQDETPAPTDEELPFQIVKVDGYNYSVDPFFPCVAFITQRVIALDPEQDIASTITMQLFVRAGDQMTALDPFTTADNELTAGASVGQAFTCAPQIAEVSGNG